MTVPHPESSHAELEELFPQKAKTTTQVSKPGFPPLPELGVHEHVLMTTALPMAAEDTSHSTRQRESNLRKSHKDEAKLWNEIVSGNPVVTKNKSSESATNVKREVEELSGKASDTATSVKDKASQSTAPVCGKAADTAASVKDQTLESSASVRGKASDTAASVKDQALESSASVRGKASDTAASVKDKALESTASIREKASDTAASVTDKALKSAASIREKAQNTGADLKNAVVDTEERVAENIPSAAEVENTASKIISNFKEVIYTKMADLSKVVEQATLQMKAAAHDDFAALKAKGIEVETRISGSIPTVADMKTTASKNISDIESCASKNFEAIKSSASKNTADMKTSSAENISMIRRKGAEASESISRNGLPTWLSLGLLLPLALFSTYGTYSFFRGGSHPGRAVAPADHTFSTPHGLKLPSFKSEYHVLDILRNAGFAQRFTSLDKINDHDGWVLQVDVPGLESREISMESSGPIMKIHGVHRCDKNSDGKNEDPTCVERYLKDEIRFPDEANMESSSAYMRNGVLFVHVKPNQGHSTSARPVRIMEQMGSSIKSTLGMKSKGGLPVHRSDEKSFPDTWTGTAAEEAIREAVGGSVDSAKNTLLIPINKQAEFMNAMKENMESMIEAVRHKTVSPSQMSDNIYQLAQHTWNTMKTTTVDGKVAAVDTTNDAIGTVKAAANSVQGGAQSAADSVLGTAKAAADTVQDAANVVGGQAMAFAADVQDKVGYAQGKISENAQYVRNRAGEAAVRAQHRLKENIQYASDRAGEASQYAADLVSEDATHLKNRVDEVTGSNEKSKSAFNNIKSTAQKVKIAAGAEEKQDDSFTAILKNLIK